MFLWGVFYYIYIYYTEQNGATYIYGRFDCYSVVSLYILLYLSCPENTRIVLICDASSLAIKPFSYDSFCWERGGILGLPKLILPVSFLEPRNFSFHLFSRRRGYYLDICLILLRWI